MSSRAKKQETQVAVDLLSRIDLKAEVEALIKPHLSTKSKPPYSISELAMMAWVCERDKFDAISEKSILQWLVTTFKSYALLALEDAVGYSGSIPFVRRTGTAFPGMASDLSSRLLDCEVPMQRVGKTARHQRGDYSKAYTSTLASARLSLRQALGVEQKHFTRFLDLPPEIRQLIYEEVLGFRGSLTYVERLVYLSGNGAGCFPVRITPPQAGLDVSSFTTAKHPLQFELINKYTDPLGKVLALLSANRQIFQEAMPVFYNINTFRAENPYQLVRMLRHCGARRLAYFSRIELAFDYKSDQPQLQKQAFRLLAQAKLLQDIHIVSSDGTFPLSKTAEIIIPKSIPWVNLLVGLNTRSLRFRGDCPRIEAYVLEKKSRVMNDGGEVARKKKSPAKPRKPKVPKSAAFCTAEDNVPTRKVKLSPRWKNTLASSKKKATKA